MREIRKANGWPAKQIANRCADAGMPELSDVVITNIETGRRSAVSVDELFCLAWALDVSPLHLTVPDEGAWRYVPGKVMHDARVGREWAAGNYALPDQDHRIYWREQPVDRWKPPEPGMRRHVTSAEMKAFFGDAVEYAPGEDP